MSMVRFGLLLFSSASALWSAGQLGRDMPQAWTPPPEYATGTSGHKTMYLLDLIVGGDSQHFRMLVDSGSSMLVVPSSDCKSTSCTNHHKLNTVGCEGTGRTASIGYGMGTVQGHVFQQKVCFASPGSTESLTEVGFLQKRSQTSRHTARASDDAVLCTQMGIVAVDQESDEYANAPYDGILGLGLRDGVGDEGMSLLNRFQADGKLSSTSFALRLGHLGDSQLILGDVDESALAAGQALWVPLSADAGSYWQFRVADLTLDGKPQEFGSFEVVVDSGTSLLSPDDGMKSWLSQRLTPENCDAVNALPKLGLQLAPDVSLPILPSDYVDREDGDCKLALMPGSFSGINNQRLILGDSFMRRYVTIFDRANRRLGFGVAADDQLARQMVPSMFPAPTTTVGPSTTHGAPPPVQMNYDNYVPETTSAPPTPEEEQKQELNTAFSALPDDLDSDFKKSVSQQRSKLQPAEVADVIANNKIPSADDQTQAVDPSTSQASSGSSYLDYLKLIQVQTKERSQARLAGPGSLSFSLVRHG